MSDENQKILLYCFYSKTILQNNLKHLAVEDKLNGKLSTARGKIYSLTIKLKESAKRITELERVNESLVAENGKLLALLESQKQEEIQGKQLASEY